MTTHTRKELIERYVRAAWILKIRLMSSRRHLWADETSLIHLETAALQLRKICEMIAYLCVIAAELEFEDIHGLRRNYRVGQVLSRLDRQNRLLFPRRARLTEKEVLGGKTLWNLDIEEVKNEDVRWLKGIHDRSGNVMHEFSPFRDFPDPQTAPYTLASDLNGIRADHQWLWNRFWQHANVLKEKLFFINLGDPSITSRPTIVKMEGFLDKEPSVDFDPNYVSDFSGEIDWAEFSS